MTRYIYWPKEYRTGEFHIGVYGEGKIKERFVELSKKRTVDGRKIKVHTLNSLESINSSHQIIFITEESSKDIIKISKKLKSAGCLIITEKAGALNIGSMINFILKDNRILFELNIKEFNGKGFSVSKELIDLSVTKNN